MTVIQLDPKQLVTLRTSLITSREWYLSQAETGDQALAPSYLASASDCLALLQAVNYQLAQSSRIEKVTK